MEGEGGRKDRVRRGREGIELRTKRKKRETGIWARPKGARNCRIERGQEGLKKGGSRKKR